jgi:hypothetical protein
MEVASSLPKWCAMTCLQRMQAVAEPAASATSGDNGCESACVRIAVMVPMISKGRDRLGPGAAYQLATAAGTASGVTRPA